MKQISLFIIITLVIQCQIFSQTNLIKTASIKGKIHDASSGIPVEGVIMSIEPNVAKEIIVTDKNGKFVFNNIPVGDYKVTMFIMGYLQHKTIMVSVGNSNVNLDLTIVPLSVNLNEVIIEQKIDKNLETSSRSREKNADNLVNVISSQAIEKSPDITAANVLQRMSGVSLERTSQGDGRYAIMRGMDQRYNNTLIDGQKIPSPNSKTRFVPLDIVSSELLERVEVTKALTPDMEGDAIGGTVNLQMKEAPDKLLLAANISTGYSQLLLDRKFSYFDRNAVNKKDPAQINGNDYAAKPEDFTRKNLAFKPVQATPNINAGLTYGQRFFKKKLGIIISGSYQDRYQGSQNRFYQTSVDQYNTPFQTEEDVRTYSNHIVRKGLNAKIDYAPDKNNIFSFSNVFLNMQDNESRHSSDTSFVFERTGPGTGFITTLDRSEANIQQIECMSLKGKHNILNNLVVDWTALYAQSSQLTPDKAEITTDLSVYSNYSKTPSYFDGITRLWQKNEDRDYTGSANITYSPKLFKKIFEFKGGGLYRTKSRYNYQNEYSLRPTLVNNVKETWTGIDSIQWSVYNTGGTPIYGTNNYSASETVLDYYGQVKASFGKLQVLTGVRVESTNQSYLTQAPNIIAGNSAQISYTDFLPSIHFKYGINENQNLRLSYFNSLSRPSYFELVPFTWRGDNYNEHGNPYLQHTTARNYDLRYEYFPNLKDELLVGVFYKTIINPVESSLKISDIYHPDLVPQNFGVATNYGFEFVLAKHIGNFSVITNYTFTKSSITASKIKNDPITQTTYTVAETRPLQGQSKHIANLSINYNFKKLGTQLQLAYGLTGKRIVQLSPFAGLDYYQANLSLLDFSLQQKVKKHFSIFIKINNILNSPYQMMLTTGLLAEKDYFGSSYLLGLKYNL
jgi:outer membrane cobalamin receptor